MSAVTALRLGGLDEQHCSRTHGHTLHDFTHSPRVATGGYIHIEAKNAFAAIGCCEWRRTPQTQH